MIKVDFDPVAFSFFGFPIRWYALSYILGIFLGSYVAKRAVKKLATFDESHIDKLVNWFVIAIIVGGRLGHVLFFEADYFIKNPLEILKIWNGGMSFHGGFLGVIIGSILFCRKYKIKLLALFDVLSVATPLGLFFGRLANFVNGELYGRFWHSPYAFYFSDNLPRHPSQLYEAFLEGLALFLIELYICFYRKPKSGVLSAIFCILYGVFRIICEYFREPDTAINIGMEAFLGITIGQILSIPMIITGAYILLSHRKKPI